MVPIFGKIINVDNAETKQIFNWEPLPFEKSILDCASSIKHLN